MQKAFYPLLVFILATLVYVPPLLDLPFSSRGEAREALVVQAMVEQQNLILPRRNGETIPSKPPFFHWAALTGVALTGTGSATEPGSEFGVRLPSAIAGAWALAILFSFAAPRLGVKGAAFAAVVLGTSVEWARSASIARVDMMFALWVMSGTLALFTLIDDYLRSSTISWKQILLVAFLLTFATLTKGPAGLAIPWAVAGLYFLAVASLRRLPILPGLAAVALTIVLSGIWYFTAYLQGGSAFLDVHLMRENFARVVGMDEYETGHEAPAYAILSLLFTGLIPWSFFLPAALWAAWRRRRILRSEEDAAVLFMVIWILFFLAFFGATASKRSVYLLPCYPACAYLIAWVLFTPGARSDSGRAMKVAAGLVAVAATALVVTLALIKAVTMLYGPALPAAALGLKIKPHVLAQIDLILRTLNDSPLIFLGLAGCAAATGYAAWLLLTAEKLPMRLHRGAYSLAGAAAVLLLLINSTLFPPIARAISPKAFMRRVNVVVADRKLYQFNNEDFHAATFYADRVVERLAAVAEVRDLGGGFILAPKARVPEIMAAGGGITVRDESAAFDVYGKDRFVLLEIPDKNANE